MSADGEVAKTAPRVAPPRAGKRAVAAKAAASRRRPRRA
jgi:hypothetical protein